MMGPVVTFEEWKKAAQNFADERMLGDLWSGDDPYDLKEDAEEAYAAGRSPVDFVREAFAEDLASQEHDEQMAADALEGGEFEDEEDDDGEDDFFDDDGEDDSDGIFNEEP